MKSQIRKTLVQIVVGAGVVVAGLMALNEFVPSFTLFPDASKPQTQEKQKDEPAKQDLPEASPQIDDLPIDEVEEATDPKTNIPVSVRPNNIYSADKRLKASNLGFFVPREVMRQAKTKITTNFHSEYCERNIPGYKKEVELYFSLTEADLAEAILFLAVKTPRITYYYKPQSPHNLLKVPNNFPSGRHKIEYGYVLKNDANKKEVPFYSRICSVTVKD